jgi:hypothetical protein
MVPPRFASCLLSEMRWPTVAPGKPEKGGQCEARGGLPFCWRPRSPAALLPPVHRSSGSMRKAAANSWGQIVQIYLAHQATHTLPSVCSRTAFARNHHIPARARRLAGR